MYSEDTRFHNNTIKLPQRLFVWHTFSQGRYSRAPSQGERKRWDDDTIFKIPFLFKIKDESRSVLTEDLPQPYLMKFAYVDNQSIIN